MELYFTASGFVEKDDKIRIAAFLHIAGEDAWEVFNTMKWDEDGDYVGDEKKFVKIVAKIWQILPTEKEPYLHKISVLHVCARIKLIWQVHYRGEE